VVVAVALMEPEMWTAKMVALGVVLARVTEQELVDQPTKVLFQEQPHTEMLGVVLGETQVLALVVVAQVRLEMLMAHPAVVQVVMVVMAYYFLPSPLMAYLDILLAVAVEEEGVVLQ
tara:strand:- start:628 stop:978 length:351 start_codon:yes stop_codon:yes gene_type:complete